MEWPPRSGQLARFPEIDRAEFVDLDTAHRKIKATQWNLVEQLVTWLRAEGRLPGAVPESSGGAAS
jgi:predicted NUDIX family NTP pyrophosphohydrolase